MNSHYTRSEKTCVNILWNFLLSRACYIPLCVYCLFVSDTCTALPSIDNLETTETLPVNYGTVLSVGCNTGHTLSGDSSITCERGIVFTYTNQPICNIGKYIFIQYFSRFKAYFQDFQRHGSQSKKFEKNPRRHNSTIASKIVPDHHKI